MVDLGPSPSSLPTYGEIMGTLSLSLVFAQAAFTFWKRNADRIKLDAARDAAITEAREAKEATKQVAHDLAKHELEVARRYVGIDMVERVEARLFAALAEVTTALRDMSARLDRAADRHTV